MDEAAPVGASFFGIVLVLGLFWALGAREGRCEATCAASGLEYRSNSGDACWCEGAVQPVRSLGSK